MLIAAAFLAISLSIDAFGLGVSYGMQKIRIPLMPKILICFSSVFYALAGLAAGSGLKYILGTNAANMMGVIILISMGAWMIHKAGNERISIKHKTDDAKDSSPGKLLEIAIKSIGITIMVMKNPEKGDIDHSGKIDLKEAALLGIALNMDAAAACIGSVMISVYSWVIPIFVGIIQMLFIEGGLLIGSKIIGGKITNKKLISIIPGLILITMGLLRLIV